MRGDGMRAEESGPRVLAAGAYQALGFATRRLVKAAGGLEAAASVTRVGKSTLGRYQDPGSGDWMPVDVVADLESESGQRFVTEALARQSGCLLLPLPAASAAAPEMAQRLARLGQEIAEVFAASAAALADGRVEPAEAARMINEIDDAVRELAGLRSLLMGVS